MLTNNEKNQVVELYKSFISNFKNEDFKFSNYAIKYIDRVQDIDFEEGDDAHYFQVTDLMYPEKIYTVITWLFFEEIVHQFDARFMIEVESCIIDNIVEKKGWYLQHHNHFLLEKLTQEIIEKNYDDDGIESLILAEGGSMMEKYFIDLISRITTEEYY